ncbi:MAG: HAD-IB family phosphatase [Dehalococcoidia bacterium]|nr:HAD-IB family phosphatase [Dehalococcoidia bacterium]
MSHKPLLVQCDFDGTLTVGDISFLILDEFTGKLWRQELADYLQGKVTVNRFNSRAFARLKADRAELIHFVRTNSVVRPGFQELLETCCEKNFRFVIVSNGMAFYIETILEMQGVPDIEFIAGRGEFSPQGMKSWYPGPDGQPIEDGFKVAWTEHFLEQGYRLIYAGNGISDFAPACRCERIFAIDSLAEECRKAGVEYIPFADLHDIARALREVN